MQLNTKYNIGEKYYIIYSFYNGRRWNYKTKKFIKAKNPGRVYKVVEFVINKVTIKTDGLKQEIKYTSTKKRSVKEEDIYTSFDAADTIIKLKNML